MFDGAATLSGKGRLAVAKDGKPVAHLAAPHVVLATGARARSLPGLEPDGKLVWTYKEAMVPEAIPKSLLVVGSARSASNSPAFTATWAPKVTVVRGARPSPAGRGRGNFRFRPQELREAGHQDPHRRDREKPSARQDCVTAQIEAGGKAFEVAVERVILAVGIVGNVENIGLEGTAAKVERSHVVVDEWLRTGEPGLYAIGDLVGPPWLAHKASHEGVICVEHIAGSMTCTRSMCATSPAAPIAGRRLPVSG